MSDNVGPGGVNKAVGMEIARQSGANDWYIVVTMFRAMQEKWPQLNHRSGLQVVADHHVRIPNTDEPMGNDFRTVWKRRAGWKGKLWRLWYRIWEAPNEKDDLVLRERGWYSTIEPTPYSRGFTFRTLHFETFGYNPDYGLDRGPTYGYNRFMLHVAYDAVTDTLYMYDYKRR